MTNVTYAQTVEVDSPTTIRQTKRANEEVLVGVLALRNIDPETGTFKHEVERYRVGPRAKHGREALVKTAWDDAGHVKVPAGASGAE